MDVDLSTDLNALLPLVAPLIAGHTDVAIGTRLSRGLAGGPRGRSGSSSPARYNLLLRGNARGAVLGRPVRVQGDPAPRSPSSCCRWWRTPAGSSTPSCWCWPSGRGCGSTRCRWTGSTTPTRGSHIVKTATEDLAGVGRAGAAVAAAAGSPRPVRRDAPGDRAIARPRTGAGSPAAAASACRRAVHLLYAAALSRSCGRASGRRSPTRSRCCSPPSPTRRQPAAHLRRPRRGNRAGATRRRAWSSSASGWRLTSGSLWLLHAAAAGTRPRPRARGPHRREPRGDGAALPALPGVGLRRDAPDPARRRTPGGSRPRPEQLTTARPELRTDPVELRHRRPGADPRPSPPRTRSAGDKILSAGCWLLTAIAYLYNLRVRLRQRLLRGRRAGRQRELEGLLLRLLRRLELHHRRQDARPRCGCWRCPARVFGIGSWSSCSPRR